MFTGIIEELGEVEDLQFRQTNIDIWVRSGISNELKIDQSVAHNGICLTVVAVDEHIHKVTAIQETLQRTNLDSLKKGDVINLERCMSPNGRFDGHIVQGHVDETAQCSRIENLDGSWKFHFKYDTNSNNITVEKGSICINGVSLTVVDADKGYFSVCIIPYTYEHTNFKTLKEGDLVNIEFDILGKYIAKYIHQIKLT